MHVGMFVAVAAGVYTVFQKNQAPHFDGSNFVKS